MLNVIPKWVLAALLSILAATSCKLKLDKDGLSLEVEKHKTSIATLTAQYETERTTAAEAYADAVDKAWETERTLTAELNLERNKADERVKAVQLAAADLTRRLRNQSNEARAVATTISAPSPVATIEAFATGSLGDELREDAIFLVGEAERADTIREELIGCYASYEKAQQALEKLRSSQHSTQTNPPDSSALPE